MKRELSIYMYIKKISLISIDEIAQISVESDYQLYRRMNVGFNPSIRWITLISVNNFNIRDNNPIYEPKGKLIRSRD